MKKIKVYEGMQKKVNCLKRMYKRVKEKTKKSKPGNIERQREKQKVHDWLLKHGWTNDEAESFLSGEEILKNKTICGDEK